MTTAPGATEQEDEQYYFQRKEGHIQYTATETIDEHPEFEAFIKAKFPVCWENLEAMFEEEADIRLIALLYEDLNSGSSESLICDYLSVDMDESEVRRIAKAIWYFFYEERHVWVLRRQARMEAWGNSEDEANSEDDEDDEI